MALNDSLSDMLARIKNAHQANKVSTLCLKSKLNMNVLSVLKDEGYIRDFKNIEERKGVSSIKIDLKYYNGRRHEDDERQISRWNGVCGVKGRWRNRLYKNISETGNWEVSPRIQQSLLHWGYLANKKDYELYLENQ